MSIQPRAYARRGGRSGDFVRSMREAGSDFGGRITSDPRLSIGDREAHAASQRGELIDRVAAGTPPGKLLFIEPLRHVRMPFAAYRTDDRTGIDLAGIDAHRAPEAAADIEV